MDAPHITKRLERRPGRKLHKNVESSIKQVLADNTPRDSNCTDTCPPSQKTIQVRRTRHAGHCWRSGDELISDVLLWDPTHGCASVGRPARTYIQQLCEDTGCNPEDLPEAMSDRGEMGERRSGISAQTARHDDDEFTQCFNYGQDVTQGQFFSGLNSKFPPS